MGAMKTIPHAYAGSRIVNFLNKQINSLAATKSQRQIAFECGYEKPNIISMFKRGETKVPLDKIPALAKALEVDPRALFRLALEQYWPEVNKVVGDIFGHVVSENEHEIIEEIRHLTNDMDPKITAEQKAQLREIFGGKSAPAKPKATEKTPVKTAGKSSSWSKEDIQD